MTWAVIDINNSDGEWSTYDDGTTVWSIGLFDTPGMFNLALASLGDLDVRVIAAGGDGGEFRGGGGGAGGFERTIATFDGMFDTSLFVRVGANLQLNPDDPDDNAFSEGLSEVTGSDVSIFAERGGDGGSMDPVAPQAAFPGGDGHNGGGGAGGNATSNAPATNPAGGQPFNPDTGNAGGGGRVAGNAANRAGGGGGGHVAAGGVSPAVAVGGPGGLGVQDDIRGFLEWVCEGGPGQGGATTGTVPVGGLNGPGCGGKGGQGTVPSRTLGKNGQVVVRVPFAEPPPADSPLFFRSWNVENQIWVRNPGRYWDGAAWVPVDFLQYWDGSNWLPVPVPPTRRIT